MSRSIKSINVQVGQSSKEAIDLSGSGMVFLSKIVYGASLRSGNGWGKVLGYADQACEHRIEHQLIRGTHPMLGDISRAKLIKAPFKEGATIQLVLAVVQEKVSERTWKDKTLPVYDTVLRIADYVVLEQGCGETQVFKPYTGKSEKPSDQASSKSDVKEDARVQEAQLEDES